MWKIVKNFSNFELMDENDRFWGVGAPQLSGFPCDYNPAVHCSNPKHTIYASSICIVEIVMRKGRKQGKEAGTGLFKKA